MHMYMYYDQLLERGGGAGAYAELTKSVKTVCILRRKLRFLPRSSAGMYSSRFVSLVSSYSVKSDSGHNTATLDTLSTTDTNHRRVCDSCVFQREP